jgi:hypothetical protein
MVLILCILSLLSIESGASVLGDAAANLQEGEWRVIETQNAFDLFTDQDGDCICNYSDNMVWDPNSKQLLFCGSGHQRPGKFVIYSEATNAWRTESKPISDLRHAYDHNAIDQASGEMYYRQGMNPDVYKYDIQADNWTSIPDMPTSHPCCGALEFFPEMNGLIFVGAGSVYFYNKAQNEWSKLADNLVMGSRHNIAEYNPVHKVMLFGGGNWSSGFSHDIYKLDGQGNITKLDSVPIPEFRISSTVVTVDPVSGEYLVFDDYRHFYAYNIQSDTWQMLDSATVPIWYRTDGSAAQFNLAAPVSEYGVVAFTSYQRNGTLTVRLYRHEGFTGLKEDGTRTASPFFSVSPNPCHSYDNIRIQFKVQSACGGKCKVQIYNIKGKLVAQPRAKSQNSFVNWDTRNLPSGIYIIKARTNNNTFTKKLFLMK